MFNEYIRNGKIIKASEKAYNVLYKSKGYKPYSEKVEVTVDDSKSPEVDDSEIILKDLTNKELRELAKEYNIDVKNKKKKEMIEALEEIVGD